MSHHEHDKNDKHDKKKKQREKNRRDWIIFQQAALLRENVDIGTPSTREGRATEKSAATPGAKPWSAKLSTIRNRLDNSKRISDDRWNRFAGTTDGGGRGR